MGTHPQACPMTGTPICQPPECRPVQVVILAQASAAHDLMSSLCGGSREPRQRLKIETDADLKRIQNIWTGARSLGRIARGRVASLAVP